MRGAALLLLPACLAVAGCGGGADANGQAALNTEMEARANRVQPDSDKVMAERWQSVFADPARTIAAANEFGYRAGAYAPRDRAYASAGVRQVLPRAEAPIRVVTDFAASGARADRIDTIRFSFDVSKAAKPTKKKDLDAIRIPDRVIRGFLGRFEVGPSDPVRMALNEGSSTEVELHGVTVKVAAEKLPDAKSPNDRRITVTFINNPEAQASS